jgi:DNA-binding CsgD family transcriptional regulator
MLEAYIPKNHISLTSSADVLEIVFPLFKATGLNYFFYSRTFNSNLSFYLHTNIPLFLSWFKNKFSKREAFLSHYLREGAYLWEDTQNTEHLKEARALNCGNGISIIKHHETFSETFVLAASLEQPHIMSLYLNQMELLNKFFLYFKDRASHLIDKAIKQPILLPEDMCKKKEEGNNNLIYEDYKKSLHIKKYQINEKYHDIRLSKRELQCLILFLKGQTAIQIANGLKLSKSSVDKFVYRVKQKFQCRTSSELVELFWDLGILKSNGWFDI